MRTARPWLQLGRSALLLVSTALNFVALRYLQLDEAVAIIFCTPFIVAVLGGPMLGEWIGWRRWTAIVRRLLRRAAGDAARRRRHSSGGAARRRRGALLRALLISTRILARSDSDETTNFYSNLVGARRDHRRGAVLLDAAERSDRHRC